MLWQLLGGLALLLGGIGLLGGALESLCAGRARLRLGGRGPAVLLGAGITAIVQSSSAVTVGVCVLSGSGAIVFSQAAGLLYGANLGTTATAWLVAAGLEGLSWVPAAAAIAALLPLRRPVRQALLGLAVLLIGLDWMTAAAAPLGQTVAPLLLRCRSPVWGFCLGAAAAAVLQTSSGTIALAQSLPLPPETALGVVLGCNVGTCATALLATISQPPAAKAAARLHLLFNLLALAPGALLLTLRPDMSIPLFHTAVNAVAILLALPLSPLLERLALRPFDLLRARRVLQ